jgi:hypothetical protein
MADEEQQIAQGIAQAFETMSERLSRELERAFAHSIRWPNWSCKRRNSNSRSCPSLASRRRQWKRSPASSRRCEATKSTATTNCYNQHAAAIEQLLQSQMKFAQHADGHAAQYDQLFTALSNRLDAVEKEAFGPNYRPQPSTPPIN